MPKSTQEVADVIGRERALFLVGQLPNAYRAARGQSDGCADLYVPVTLKPEHSLVALLGWPDAMRMVRAFGGCILQLSKCCDLLRDWRDTNIRRLHRDGMNVAELADWFSLSDRMVRNIVREEIPHEANDNVQAETARRA